MKHFLQQIVQRAKSLLLRLILGRFYEWSLWVVKYRLHGRFAALHSGLDINEATKANLYNFRRNIHRLEKGLSQRKQKGAFAEGYILETVEYLHWAGRECDFDAQTRQWGESVLNAYFAQCPPTPAIAKARRCYESFYTARGPLDWIPYEENQRPALAVDYAGLRQLALRRRSVRHYLARPADRELVRKAMEIAAQSPSACNRQAFKFLFYDETELVRRIVEIPGGVVGYELPSVIVVVGSYRGYFDARDFNVPVIDASLASMAFVLALETLGLASVCINWSCSPENDRMVRDIVTLQDDEFVVMLIGVGYPSPDGKIPFSAKRPVDDLLILNTPREYAANR